ncbi:hypothetical protein QP150_11750 [Sphingomonas sp. 22L2VL55-3]
MPATRNGTDRPLATTTNRVPIFAPTWVSAARDRNSADSSNAVSLPVSGPRGRMPISDGVTVAARITSTPSSVRRALPIRASIRSTGLASPTPSARATRG